MSRFSILAWLAASELVLGACDGGGSGGSPSGGLPAVGGDVTNLGLAAGRIEGDDELLVVAVSEMGQGGADRNLDGDALDEVAFVYDLASESGRDLRISLSPSFPFPLEVGGWVAALVTSEAGQGDSDLNRDGDVSDDVLSVYVHDRSGARTLDSRLALAPFRPRVEGGFVAFAVSEAAQGNRDLNGDGDALDAVPRVIDSTGIVRGPSVALTELLALSGGWALFTTDEAQLGSDLNGDGDAVDAHVLQFFEFHSGWLVNSGLDASLPVLRQDILMVVQFIEWMMMVDEQAGGIDLDGDGDADDLVPHAYSPATGIATNLALAAVPRAPLLESVSGSFCLLARESEGLDRNGDGDFEDVTPTVYGWGNLNDIPLAVDPSSSGVVWSRSALVLDVSEAAQGADLDGDGDRADLVVHVVDGRGPRNLRLDSQGLTGAPGHVLIPRSELDAGADWNGDGDQLDLITFVRNSLTERTSNTAIAGLVLGASGKRLLLAVPERDDGRDWNQDGDLDDVAYVHHELALVKNVGLRGLLGAFPGWGRVLSSGHSVVLADEASQASDLNRDGDQNDSVPFVVE
ncbi:MAG: hypothetical protein HOP15_12690 [Planctomycetes bacterium]|nr:hypothetical protein [Planctomycetota bacterium]